jgi:hypothetical protein
MQRNCRLTGVDVISSEAGLEQSRLNSHARPHSGQCAATIKVHQVLALENSTQHGVTGATLRLLGVEPSCPGRRCRLVDVNLPGNDRVAGD